ncbi:MAG: AAA family ATPase [Spirochaetales bacterium]|nr:AAA family ATPase [Spirochaetales bacterium]
MKEKYKLTYPDIKVEISEDDISKYCEEEKEYEIIGQPRALKALMMGIEIPSKGYNIFVTGLSGTGKRTAISKILKNIKRKNSNLSDITVVYNFKRPEKPRILFFPQGKGKEFKSDIHSLIENLKSLIKLRLESKHFQKEKDKLVKNLEQHENRSLSEFESILSRDNFQIVQLGDGDDQVTDIVPLYKGKSVDFDELQGLVQSGEIAESYWNKMREKYFKYMDDMKKIFKDLRAARNEVDDKLKELGIKEIKPLVETEIERLKAKYKSEESKDYLIELCADIIKNIYLFTSSSAKKHKNGGFSLIRYGVNILVDNSDIKNVPVIFELHPTYANLFGTVESKVEIGGEVRTNFMMVRAGSLIHANGGFLILNAEDILREDFSWQSLKNALMSGKVEIQQIESTSLIPGSKIKPEALPINVKVIIIGNPNLYEILYSMDEDFQKLFKISAEFDSVIKRSKENTQRYVTFIKHIVKDHDLKEIVVSGICKVIEHGIRIAERKDLFTTRFSQIADIIKEADYWAGKMKKKKIDGDAVSRAIKERNYLLNLPEEKILELIVSGDILISVKGSAVGRINGLAIYDRGYYAFGRPSLITARIAPGDIGIINIERESGLSGEFHDKGILILEGLLRSRYAHDFPLSITASICFEQSYSHIDGDSASSAEVFALLSAIAEVPLRQDIAVTGSVNQMGEIQPIGGVSEKVEGFFKVCKQMKLSKTQGVIIPAQNVKNLILSHEVENAIKKNEFSIYAISTIDEGIEILSGMSAGVCDKKGEYPEGSLNRLVKRRLKHLANKVKEFGK